MPSEQTFDPAPGMLSPAHIASPVPGFPETVVVTFSPPLVDLMTKTGGREQISELHAGYTLPIYRFTHEGHPLGAYFSPLGGSACGALMEEVIAKGARRFLFFGSCGTLEKGVDAGHIIVPTAAWRDEGTSYHYLPASDEVAVPTAPTLCRVLDALAVPYRTGKTWTTDGFYRETAGNAEKRRQAGCLCVEMECASVMAIGQFRRIPVYQFVYGADSLSGESWDPRILGSISSDLKERLARLALSVAVRLKDAEKSENA